MFGGNNAFGAFGQSSSSASGGIFGGIGTQAPAGQSLWSGPQAQPTTGFGGFGQSQPQTTGGFGFGQPAQQAGFGLAQPQQTLGAFGQPQQQANPSGFGPFAQQQPTTTTTPSPFGGFGQPQSTPSPFGQQQQTTTTQPTASPFGQGAFTQAAQPPTGGFGFGLSTSTAPQQPFSGFGGGVVGTNTLGTSTQKYQSTYDPESRMKLVSICAMDTYKSKSLEELRFEDYRGGRGTKPQQTGFSSTVSPFSIQPAAGSTGQVSPSPFGAAAATSSTSPFSFSNTTTQQQPASSFFPQTTPSPFGPPSASPSTGVGMSFTGFPQQQQNAPVSIFNAAPPQQGNIFGTTPTAPATSSPFSFTTTQQPQVSNLFSAPNANTTTPSIFSAPASTTGNMFFNNPSSSSSTSPFGQQQQQQSPASIFPTTPSIFNMSSPQTQSNTGGGGLFSFQPSTSSSSSSSSIFSFMGSNQSSPSFPSGTGQQGGLFGPSQPQQPSMFSTGQSPSSLNPLFQAGNTSAVPAGQFLAVPPSIVFPVPPKPTSLLLPRVLDKSYGNFLWRSEPSSVAPISHSTRLLTSRRSSSHVAASSPRSSAVVANFNMTSSAPSSPSLRRLTILPSAASAAIVPLPAPSSMRRSSSQIRSPSPRNVVVPAQSFKLRPVEGEEDQDDGELKPRKEAILPGNSKKKIPCAAPPAMIPRLENRSFFCKPSIETLSEMTEDELSRVELFAIGSFGLGCITWEGRTDLRYLNIDELVRFERGSVTVYPEEDGQDDKKRFEKPPVGEGLNKAAVIELIVKPQNFGRAKRNEEKYVEKMKDMTERMGAEFISYDLEIWRFRVLHFSKWGVDTDEWNVFDRDVDGMFMEIGEDEREDSSDEDEDEDASVIANKENDDEEDQSLYPLVSVSRYPVMDLSSLSPCCANQEKLVGDRGDGLEFKSTSFFPKLRYQDLVSDGWSMRHGDSFLCESFRSSFLISGSLRYPVVSVPLWNSSLVDLLSVEHRKDQKLLFPDVVLKSLEILRDSKISGKSIPRNFQVVKDVLTCLLGAEGVGGEIWRIMEFFKVFFESPNWSLKDVVREWLANILSFSSPPPSMKAPIDEGFYWLCAGNFEKSSLVLRYSGYFDESMMVASCRYSGAREILKKYRRQSHSDSSSSPFEDLLAGNINEKKFSEVGWRVKLCALVFFCDLEISQAFEKLKSMIARSSEKEDFDFQLLKFLVANSTSEQFVSLVSNKDPLLWWFMDIFLHDKPLPRNTLNCAEYVEVIFNRESADSLWQWVSLVLAFLPFPQSQIDNLVFRHSPLKMETELNKDDLEEKFPVLSEVLRSSTTRNNLFDLLRIEVAF